MRHFLLVQLSCPEKLEILLVCVSSFHTRLSVAMPITFDKEELLLLMRQRARAQAASVSLNLHSLSTLASTAFLVALRLHVHSLLAATFPYEAPLIRKNNFRRQGFTNRQAGRANGNVNQNQQRSQNPSPTTGNPTMPPSSTPVSFPTNPGSSVDNDANGADSPGPEPTKFFFQEKYAKLGVRGNFMPLAALPKYVDAGDWLAHQSKSVKNRGRGP